MVDSHTTPPKANMLLVDVSELVDSHSMDDIRGPAQLGFRQNGERLLLRVMLSDRVVDVRIGRDETKQLKAWLAGLRP
jgi:hypothetical protein